MKRLQIILILCLIPFVLSAQIDPFFSKYRDLEGATTIQFHGNLLRKILSNDNNHGVSKHIDDLVDLEILSIEEDLMRVNPRDIDRLKDDLSDSDWEVLVVVRDNPTHVKFLAKEDGDVIRELVMMVDEPDKFTLARFRGRISLKHMGEVCENIQINGKNYFASLD